MTATAHALIGACIATKISNPVLAISLSFLSHFLCDKIPHWDVMTKRTNKTQRQIFTQSAADVLLSLTLITLLFFFAFQNTSPINIFLSAFAAQLPDWLEIPYTIFHYDWSLAKADYRVQKWIHDLGYSAKLGAPWGIVTQALVVAIFLFWAIV